MKILFTDLDCTLLNNASLISDHTKDILKSFTDKGHLLVPNSGRPLLSMQKLIKQTGIESMVRYMIAYNGALIWDCMRNLALWSACVDLTNARIIQDTCFDMGIHIQTYNDETVYTVKEDREIKYYTRRIFLPVKYTPDPVGMCKEDPCKMLAIDLDSHERLCQLKDRLTPIIGNRINMVFSNENYLEFFNINAGKGNGITELCKLLNIPVSDTLAAGDEENDISMLEASGCGIAMANATPPVKAVADIVTEYDNEHDGLAEYLRSYI